jgi:hypothetical protein
LRTQSGPGRRLIQPNGRLCPGVIDSAADCGTVGVFGFVAKSIACWCAPFHSRLRYRSICDDGRGGGRTRADAGLGAPGPWLALAVSGQYAPSCRYASTTSKVKVDVSRSRALPIQPICAAV